MNKLTMTCKSVANPDHGQRGRQSDPRVIEGSSLEEIRIKAREYITNWALGGGNWPNCKVQENGKVIGYMSYNGRFWKNLGEEITWLNSKETI